MKKYILFVLVAILLVGLFSSAERVNASAYSNCMSSDQADYGVCKGLAGDPGSSSSSGASGGGCNLSPTNAKVQNLLTYATCIISTAIIPLIFALATVLFIWGVVQYVINSDDEAKKSKGRDFMIWGIIALTVMVSVWGLVRILGNTFGIDAVIPQVKSPN